MRRTASKSFTIPWDFDSPPDLKFDGQCVCCGRPTPDTFPLKVTHATQARIKEASIELPLCARCARDDMRNGLISFGIFFLVGGLAAIALFIFTWARVAELSPVLGIDTRQAGEVSRVAAALTALVGGCAIGLCAELAAKALLFPFLGSAFRFAPLLAVELFTGAGYKAGVRHRLSQSLDALQITFMNPDIAAEFRRRNASWIIERAA